MGLFFFCKINVIKGNYKKIYLLWHDDDDDDDDDGHKKHSVSSLKNHIFVVFEIFV